jgi:serine/threonine protein kinase
VFRCRKYAGSHYAVKIIDKARIMQKPQHVKFLKREISMGRVLQHKYIACQHAVYEDEVNIYIILDLVTGGELLDLVSGGEPVSEEAAKTYISCILQAIAYMHSINVVHRDVKLENILLSQEENGKPCAVLTDLGLARRCTEDNITEKCGSIGYVGPEVFMGGYGLKTDCFSIGVVLYTCLCARMPFGTSNTAERNM